MKILFIGDIFGNRAARALVDFLPKYREENKIDLIIAQGENVSGRKGLKVNDYKILKSAGIDVITMGNHVWAKDEIQNIIKNNDIVRPYNISSKYPGHGTTVVEVKGKKIRITEMMGISFNKLGNPWEEEAANNFFDAFDEIEKNEEKCDYHLLDFHAETTSEKNVFGLYVDGKIDAFVGTHTHVQTNDYRELPKGTLYITDVGMTGPTDCAIGADYNSVYQKMRFDKKSRFFTSDTKLILNAVQISLEDNNRNISPINIYLKE